MGCCISYYIGFENEKALNDALVFVANEAAKMGFKVLNVDLQKDRKALDIHPHPKCETMNFEFRRVEDWEKDGGHYLYGGDTVQHPTPDRCGDRNYGYPFVRAGMWYAAAFTKTEYAPKTVHAKVCELLRIFSMFAPLIRINDEAGFYETRSKKALLEGHGYLAGEKVNDLKVL